MLGHFWVPKTLTFKMSLSARPFLWKWVLFTWEWKSFPYQRLSMHLTSFFGLRGTRKWPILLLCSFYVSVLLACSSDIFFRCANVFARESTMLKLQKRGKSKGGGGVGEREEKMPGCFFFLPSSFPLSFFLPSTYLKGYYFYSL